MVFFKKSLKKCFQLNSFISIDTSKNINKQFIPNVFLNLDDSCLKNEQNINNQIIENHLDQSLSNFFDSISISKEQNYHIRFDLNKERFILNVINSFKNGIDNYNDFFGYDLKKKKILIEFSSPNIAKKIHYGNFRSTIIGSFLSNLYDFKGHDVKRINYLGDWGTQFGILSLAYDSFGDDEKLKKNPSQHLLDVYIKGNKLAEEDESFRLQAKARFDCLENQTDENIFNQWKHFRDLSLTDYLEQYNKLGIYFDSIQFESNFNQKAKVYFKNLVSKNLFQNEDGSLIYNFNEEKLKKAVLLKKNGTTLYLTRDIIAAIERKKSFNFDRCLYVVDNSQRQHFVKLKTILKDLEFDWYEQLIHVPFGRVHGLSTRKGGGKLFDEVLNVCEKFSQESSLDNLNTKLTKKEIEKNKLHLSLACLIVKDFSNSIAKDYKFDFDAIVSQKGKTGISLQYTYSRLCNLRLNSGHNLNLNCEIDLDAIKGDDVLILLSLICKFDVIIETALQKNQPKYIVKYLFDLSKVINRTYLNYQVKNQSRSCGETRLLLFYCAEIIFKKSLQLIGIRALKKI